jgi:hypothetical protein
VTTQLKRRLSGTRRAGPAARSRTPCAASAAGHPPTTLAARRSPGWTARPGLPPLDVRRAEGREVRAASRVRRQGSHAGCSWRLRLPQVGLGPGGAQPESDGVWASSPGVLFGPGRLLAGPGRLLAEPEHPTRLSPVRSAARAARESGRFRQTLTSTSTSTSRGGRGGAARRAGSASRAPSAPWPRRRASAAQPGAPAPSGGHGAAAQSRGA